MLFTKSWHGQYLLFKKSGVEADLQQDNGPWFAFGYPKTRLRESTLGKAARFESLGGNPGNDRTGA
jgi:hypothetical protein